LRYTELNPVRASLVGRAECWDWSSAAAHCVQDSTEAWLAMHLWRGRWSAVTWRAYLYAGVAESQLTAIRHSTYSGRPLGSQQFTRMLEKETKRRLTPQKRGPKKKTDTSENQKTFFFGA
jgi:putative transposase